MISASIHETSLNESFSLTDVSFKYGRQVALGNVSCAMTSRSIALLGPNGAGKSTLLRLLTTEVPLQSGSFIVRGEAIEGPVAVQQFRRRLGVMPQSLQIMGWYTCADFLHYVAWLRQVPVDRAGPSVRRALNAVGLTELANHRVRTLSGGQRQRLGLAQALVADPSFLVLDEPTVGLDPQQRNAFRGYLQGLVKSSVVLFATHLVEDVAAVADEVIILDRGRVKFFGGVTELCAMRSRPSGPELEAAYLRVIEDTQ